MATPATHTYLACLIVISHYWNLVLPNFKYTICYSAYVHSMLSIAISQYQSRVSIHQLYTFNSCLDFSADVVGILLVAMHVSQWLGVKGEGALLQTWLSVVWKSSLEVMFASVCECGLRDRSRLYTAIYTVGSQVLVIQPLYITHYCT